MSHSSNTSRSGTDPLQFLLSFSNSQQSSVARPQLNDLSLSNVVYREMDAKPLQKVDVIEDIHKNLKSIREKQARLKFLIREVSYLLKV